VKLKEGDIVEITWCDTNEPEQTCWRRKREVIESAQDEDTALVKSYGIFIWEDRTKIIIAGDISVEGFISRDETIMKGYIRKIRKLK
jgi:hypothetical protein